MLCRSRLRGGERGGVGGEVNEEKKGCRERLGCEIVTNI